VGAGKEKRNSAGVGVTDVTGVEVVVVVEATHYDLDKMGPDSLEKTAAALATSQTESAEVHDVAEVEAE
jgi:hypothetical protein